MKTFKNMAISSVVLLSVWYLIKSIKVLMTLDYKWMIVFILCQTVIYLFWRANYTNYDAE